ncbi:MAG: hypothetical protein Q9191_001065 [Dirinaria sp. TL-2023a]
MKARVPRMAIPAATPTPTPTPTATWLFELLLGEEVGLGEVCGAAVGVGEEDVRRLVVAVLDVDVIVEVAEEVAEALAVGGAVRCVTIVATPKLKVDAGVEQQSDLVRS